MEPTKEQLENMEKLLARIMQIGEALLRAADGQKVTDAELYVTACFIAQFLRERLKAQGDEIPDDALAALLGSISQTSNQWMNRAQN